MAIYSNSKRNIENKKRYYNKNLGITLICVFFPILLNLILNFFPGINSILLGIFGLSLYAISLFMFVIGILFCCNRVIVAPKSAILYACLAFGSLILILQVLTTKEFDLSFNEFISSTYASKMTAGGVVFSLISFPFMYLMQIVGSAILFAILLVVFTSLLIDVLFVNSTFQKTALITKSLQEEQDKQQRIEEKKKKQEAKVNEQKRYDENIFIADDEKDIVEEPKIVNAENQDKDRERILNLLGLNKKKKEEKVEEPVVEEEEEENTNLLYTKKDIFNLSKEYEATAKPSRKSADNKPPVFIHTEDEVDADPNNQFVFNEKPQKQMSEKERLNREFLYSISGKTLPKPVEKPIKVDPMANLDFHYDAYEQNEHFNEDFREIFGNPMREYEQPKFGGNFEQNNFQQPNSFNMFETFEPTPFGNSVNQNNNKFGYGTGANINNFNNNLNQGNNNSFGFNSITQVPNNNFNNKNSQNNMFGETNSLNNTNNSFAGSQKFGYETSKPSEIISSKPNSIENSIGTIKPPTKYDNPNPKFGYTSDAKNIDINPITSNSNNFEKQKDNRNSNKNNDLYDENLTKKSYKEHKNDYINALDKLNQDISKFEDKDETKEFDKSNKDKNGKEVQLSIEQIKPEKEKKEEPKVPKYKNPPVYNRPTIDLLEVRESQTEIDEEELAEKAKVLEEMLSNFKIPAKVCSILKGPAFTRFEMQMPAGVSVTKITNYINDIQMSLMTYGSIKMEIPIPGKNAFGVEVPNKVIDTVGLRDIIDSEAFKNSKSLLTFSLGKDISGESLVARLDKMPHALVAGQTGSGKSVCINSLIISLIYKASPQELRFILVDPKQVEFTFYNGLPHLLTPNVITEVDKAVSSFEWAIREMERRYMTFRNFSVRNIEEYNQTDEVKNGFNEKMPYIVIIVDELADLISQAKKEIEEKINRLAAKARAAGIHLILATQRPSVDVITGTVKANLPARIAFAVQAPQDSKTILNIGGAERLLGKGDMLYLPSDSPELKRIQGAFVSNDEIKKIVNYVIENNEADFDEEIEKAMFSKSGGGGFEVNSNEEEFDPLMKDAVRVVIKTNGASISKLQRAFGIGYPRAGKIVDQMERVGFISPPDNKNNRTIYITQQEFEERFGEDL